MLLSSKDAGWSDQRASGDYQRSTSCGQDSANTSRSSPASHGLAAAPRLGSAEGEGRLPALGTGQTAVPSWNEERAGRTGAVLQRMVFGEWSAGEVPEQRPIARPGRHARPGFRGAGGGAACTAGRRALYLQHHSWPDRGWNWLNAGSRLGGCAAGSLCHSPNWLPCGSRQSEPASSRHRHLLPDLAAEFGDADDAGVDSSSTAKYGRIPRLLGSNFEIAAPRLR